MIAIVDFHVAPTDQQSALDVLQGDAAAAAQALGCRAFRVFSNAGDAGHVGLMHEWDSAEDLSAYLASDGFAQVGQALRPLMTAPPESRRFNAQLVETDN